MNQWDLEARHVIGNDKRGKTRETKSRLVLFLYLIGWVSGKSILSQS